MRRTQPWIRLREKLSNRRIEWQRKVYCDFLAIVCDRRFKKFTTLAFFFILLVPVRRAPHNPNASMFQLWKEIDTSANRAANSTFWKCVSGHSCADFGRPNCVGHVNMPRIAGRWRVIHSLGTFANTITIDVRMFSLSIRLSCHCCAGAPTNELEPVAQIKSIGKQKRWPDGSALCTKCGRCHRRRRHRPNRKWCQMNRKVILFR